MDVEDYIDPKVGVAVAATAVVFSPRAREVLHRGAVYGLAGVLAVGDAVAALGRGVTTGARRVREDRVREDRQREDRERELSVADERASASTNVAEAGTEADTGTGTTGGTTGRSRRRGATETTSAGEDE